MFLELSFAAITFNGAGASTGNASAARNVAPGLSPATQTIENRESIGFTPAAITAL